MPPYMVEHNQSVNTATVLSKLQDLDQRINLHRTIAQQTMTGLQQCGDPSSMHPLKMRLTSSASTLEALLQEKVDLPSMFSF
jgi:hypothetical protein